MDTFSRTELIFGKTAMEILANARVAVFGIGGVGGYVVEALARSGVGALDLIDNDKVCPSNLNRQIIALHSTIGQYKTEAAKARILDINPACQVRTHCVFYLPETAENFDFTQYDYIVDAIDTVTAKIEMAVQANRCHTPMISSMGTGNKVDPGAFQVADIYATSVCPLARVMRRELKKRGVPSLKVLYSKEMPIMPKHSGEEQRDAGKKIAPGSNAFVPSAAGLMIAGEVIKDLTGIRATYG